MLIQECLILFSARHLEQVRLLLLEGEAPWTVLWRRDGAWCVYFVAGSDVLPLLEGVERGPLHVGHVFPTAVALSSEPGSAPWPSAPRASFLFLFFILFLLL